MKRFIIDREDDVALEFNGSCLASADEEYPPGTVTRAAIYKTKAGKHITEFSRRSVANIKPFSKAAVFDSIEEAFKFFRPGRHTNRLLEQLDMRPTKFVE